VGADHPALLVEPTDGTDEEILADQIVRPHRLQARSRPVGDERDPRLEKGQDVLVAQLTSG